MSDITEKIAHLALNNSPNHSLSHSKLTSIFLLDVDHVPVHSYGQQQVCETM